MKKILATLTVLALFAVGSWFVWRNGGDGTQPSRIWQSSGDIRSQAEGVPRPFGNTLAEQTEMAAAIVEVKIEGVAEVRYLPQAPESETTFYDEESRERFRLINTLSAETISRALYSATVETWVKGDGPAQIKVWGYDLSFFPDGATPLEVGRRYILFLDTNPPHDGTYAAGLSRKIFDITTGKVLVMNHPLTRDLEQYEGMTPEAFLATVAQ